MTVSPAAIDTLQRLVEQVQALSSVVETLTLRLLDLEERLQLQERLVSEATPVGLAPEAEQRLADTEERLQGLEQMLAPESQPHPVPAAESAASDPELLEAPDAERLSSATTAEETEDADSALELLGEEEQGWQVEEDWAEQERLIA